MTFDEMNEFFLHYVNDDKSKSAIMLTAPWGTGKSYYIQNNLKPFLESKKNGKHKCIVISLYGLTNFFEVSKAIYVENHVKTKNRKKKNGKYEARKSKGLATGIIIGKTVVRYVANRFNVDIACSDRDLKKLFESVDLSGKLVVLEDVERSGIDILDVMGYVNNLVEQDGVKVLLVANEDEILKFVHEGKNIGLKEKKKIEEKQNALKVMGLDNENAENKKEIEYNPKTNEYLRIKEKTVSDTVNFKENYHDAIKNIITMFNNKILNEFSDEKELNSILSLINDSNHPNLRSFIFACQKTIDIFECLEKENLVEKNFVRAVFFGIIIFVQNQKLGKKEKWEQEKFFSINLGSKDAPLFKFCYEYIVNQKKDFSEVKEANAEYCKYALYDEDKSNGDDDILTLLNYYVKKESEVINALKNIEKRLENPEDIAFSQYGTLAVCSIVLKKLLGYDVTKIQKQLVKNLKGRGHEIQFEYLFYRNLGDGCDETQRKEYKLLRKEMLESLNDFDKTIKGFNYRPDQSKIFYNYAVLNKNKFIEQKAFAKNLDVEKIAEMFKESTSEQMNEIRTAFSMVYREDGANLSGDMESIVELQNTIKKIRSEKNGDKIQQKQFEWFIENLEQIKEKLS